MYPLISSHVSKYFELLLHDSLALDIYLHIKSTWLSPRYYKISSVLIIPVRAVFKNQAAMVSNSSDSASIIRVGSLSLSLSLSQCDFQLIKVTSEHSENCLLLSFLLIDYFPLVYHWHRQINDSKAGCYLETLMFQSGGLYQRIANKDWSSILFIF